MHPLFDEGGNMTFPNGMFGDGDQPEVPDFLKAMLGGDSLPPGMEGILGQFSAMSEGMQANAQQLKVSVALQVQRAAAQLEFTEARLQVCEAEVAKFTARGLHDLSPEERKVNDAELAAAQKMVAAYERMVPAARELFDLAQTEATAALQTDGDLISRIMGQGGQVPGDDMIPTRKPDEDQKP
jgi:hypothetical protein